MALLALAAAAPAPPAGPGPVPLTGAPPSQFYPPCETFLASGGGDSVYSFPNSQGITQPLPPGVTTAACSLRVEASPSAYNGMRTTLEQWDPLALVPDAGTIALRTSFVDVSALQYLGGHLPPTSFVPPVVTRSLDHIAEPPRLTTALEVAPVYSNSDEHGFYDPAGSSALPAGRVIGPGGVRGPLPGTHPVFAHTLCGGDADLQQLRVAQSVMRTNTLPPIALNEVAQRFRVPELVELRWVEVAPYAGSSPAQLRTNGNSAGVPAPTMPVSLPVIGIIDGDAMPAPGGTMPPTLVEATLSYNYLTDRPVWMSHIDLDHTVLLQPQHDYWLYVRNLGGMRCYRATLTGGEGADFTSGIGPYYERWVTGNTWIPTSGYALSFRVVGRPLANLGVPPSPSRGDLLLRIAPNPARGAAEAIWSGGVGPVRLEVFDARGRRVGEGVGGTAGAWHWTSRDAKGEPLPAGVYFVHARDSAGDRAVERLVIVR